MLDLVEKVVAGLAVFLVLITLGVYVWMDIPTTTPVAALPAAERVPAAAPKNGSAPQEKASPEEQVIIEKLARQDVRVLPGQKLVVEELKVPAQTFEVISAEANWVPELKKAQHRMIKVNGRDTRLKIYNIEDGSLLKKLGLQENDTIELLDGEIVEHDERQWTRYQSLWNGALKKMREGKSVSVTVTRNNRPVHLTFKL